MKRSTLLVFLTFAILVLAFSAYLFFAPQSQVTRLENTLTPTARRMATTKIGQLGQGEGAWVKQFDMKTGALTSEFRGDEYERQPDGNIHVTNPKAEFYLNNGQIMRLEGVTGVVTVPESLRPGKDQVFSGPTQPPTRGDLHDVILKLYHDAAATTPLLTCVMDNATFDNETSRIFTQDSVIDGRNVPADQIPVTLRGVDYDFDGNGLIVRMDQRDRRLEYLEVTHGKRLTVKNPSKLNESLQPATAPSSLMGPLPEMYAANGPVPVPAPTTRDVPPPLYRASFRDHVRVIQSGLELATGDELQVDFLFHDTESTTKPTTRTHAKATATKEVEQSAAATAQASTSPATTAPTPTSKPAQPPVTIYWTGKLTLVPITLGATEEVPKPNDSLVHLTGSPLKVRQGPSMMTGSALTYRTGNQHLNMHGSDASPLVLNDGKGAIIHGTTIDYLQQDRLALLDGPGTAVKVLPSDDPNQPGKKLSTKWSKSATLFFAGEGAEPLRIETAKLAGSVEVRHPQLNLNSDKLRLDFDAAAPSTKPVEKVAGQKQQGGPDFTASDLRHLDAQGAVTATVVSANGRPQTIQTEHLLLDTASTPDGRIYPKTLQADGAVYAHDADQQLHSGHLKAYLFPTTGPVRAKSQDVPVELQHLTATDSVTVKTADGVSASADRLDVDVDQARQQHVRLLGTKETPARVASKENIVTGPYIEILPADQAYHVRGPGTMHLVQRETPQSKPRPVDVAWTDSVDVKGKENRIVVVGGVKVLSTDDAGAVNTATGERLTMTLADNPHPGTHKVAATRKATPVTGIAAQGDPMQDKVVQMITFEKGATVQSVQGNAAGDLMKQMNLDADVVSYDMVDKRVMVPVPGRMLMVNHVPEKASTQGSSPAGAKGTTAFSWSQNMLYDQSANLMMMKGDTIVAHEADTNSQSFRLESDTVFATLEEKQQAGSGIVADAALKHVKAIGGVHFTSKTSQLTASSVDYDPATGIMEAHSVGRDMVHLYDANGEPTLTAREISLDTKTGQSLKMTDVQGRTHRR